MAAPGTSAADPLAALSAKFVPVVLEDDAFLKKWSGPLLVGPFVPAVVSLFVIVTGQNVINTWQGTCGYPLNSFVAAAVAVCYLFLLVYTWIFLGWNVDITLDKKRRILSPFSSLKWVLAVWVGLGALAFIIFCVGSGMATLAAFCLTTAPELYLYAGSIIALFWIGFVIVIYNIFKLAFMSNVNAMISATLKGPTMNELEERIFKKKFGDFDIKKEGKIPADVLEKLITELGVFVPKEEIKGLQKNLDPKATGFITFEIMSAWFQKLNAMSGDDGGDKDEGKDD